MAKNTSILLGEHFDNFVNHQVKTGRYASASEVVRAALRLFEQEEKQKIQLANELIKGEQSGFVPDTDRKTFIDQLHDKYLRSEVPS